MQVSVKKELRFEYAHRLFNYVGKCHNIHGHNEIVWVYFRRTDFFLNDIDMVIDFNDIKSGIGKWIDDNWDHSILLNKEDKKTIRAMEKLQMKLYIMSGNPTAELIAHYLLHIVGPKYYSKTLNNLELYKVEVFENDFSVAVAEL